MGEYARTWVGKERARNYFLAERSQDEIIPENFRAKVEQEEKAKELADSYLPPRSRKTLQQINLDSDGKSSFAFVPWVNRWRARDDRACFTGEGDKRGKKKKKDDSAASSGEESDEDRPRKRGRPRASARDAYKGFTDAEVRNPATRVRFFERKNERASFSFFFRYDGLLRVLKSFPRR